jgi:hypothetical protein
VFSLFLDMPTGLGFANLQSHPIQQLAYSSAVSANVAAYLLQDLLPIPVILSVIWSRMTIPFFISGVVAAAASASRYLFGK